LSINDLEEMQATKLIALQSASSTWTFEYCNIIKSGKVITLQIRAVATTNTSTIQIADFKTKIGDMYQQIVTAVVSGDLAKAGRTEFNGNNLMLVMDENFTSGTILRATLTYILK